MLCSLTPHFPSDLRSQRTSFPGYCELHPSWWVFSRAIPSQTLQISCLMLIALAQRVRVRQLSWTGCFCSPESMANLSLLKYNCRKPRNTFLHEAKCCTCQHNWISLTVAMSEYLNTTALHQAPGLVPIHRSQNVPGCGGKQVPPCLNPSSPIHCCQQGQDGARGPLKSHPSWAFLMG